MEERLLDIGAWLKVNGEAIYGTRPAARSCQWTGGERPAQQYGEFMVKYELMDQVGQQPRDGRAVKQVFYTKKPGALYAITVGWPGSELVLRDVKLPEGAEVTMLGVPGVLRWKAGAEGVVVTMPRLGPGEAPCRYAFTLKLPGGEVAAEKP